MQFLSYDNKGYAFNLYWTGQDDAVDGGDGADPTNQGCSVA